MGRQFPECFIEPPDLRGFEETAVNLACGGSGSKKFSSAEVQFELSHLVDGEMDSIELIGVDANEDGFDLVQPVVLEEGEGVIQGGAEVAGAGSQGSFKISTLRRQVKQKAV